MYYNTRVEFRQKCEFIRSEGAKHLAAKALEFACDAPGGEWLVRRYSSPFGHIIGKRLATTAGGVVFDNPIMVGAGWDKTGESARGLMALGFAGVEVGSVTPLPQSGNPAPRLWTIDRSHKIAINRMGLNNPGMDAVAENLERFGPFERPIGISIAKNESTPAAEASGDFARVTERLAPYAGYIALNASCPNNPGRGELQTSYLNDIIQSTLDAMELAKPVFVKISPDLTGAQIDSIVEVVSENGCAGIIATNTTTDRDGVDEYGERWVAERGGLSGAHAPYQRRSTGIIRHIRCNSPAELDIIGVGGVCDLDSALDKLRAGASVLQVVTAIRGSYGRVAGRVNRQLLGWMDRRGVDTLREVIGDK